MSASVAFKIEQLNMRGPGRGAPPLPVKGWEPKLKHIQYFNSNAYFEVKTNKIIGILYRQYPFDFKAGRRLDEGGYVTIGTFDESPSRVALEQLFYEDSEIRDKDLSFTERLRRQIPNFG